MHTRSLGAD